MYPDIFTYLVRGNVIILDTTGTTYTFYETGTRKEEKTKQTPRKKNRERRRKGKKKTRKQTGSRVPPPQRMSQTLEKNKLEKK